MLNLAEENGESHVTRFIRDHNNVLVCGAEFDTIELLYYFTKCHLHKKCCFNKGWVATCNTRGDKTIVPRDGTDEHPPEYPRYPILCWICFWRIWKDRYSNIRIRPPSRDTCGMYFKHNILVQKRKPPFLMMSTIVLMMMSMMMVTCSTRKTCLTLLCVSPKQSNILCKGAS